MTAESKEKTHWHALPMEEVAEQLGSDCAKGLSQDEAKKRLRKCGPNKLPSPKKTSTLQRFVRQFHNVLIYVLLAAAFVTAILGQWIDTGVILAVVLVNAMIGFVQEGKAEKALDMIRQMLALKATVLREGQRQRVPAEELVPGDVVFIKSGDRVPADLRLFEAKNLLNEEAVLTGESEPVEKTTEPVEEDAAVGDRFCMAFSSTMVAHGQAGGIVVGTGAESEIGRISTMLAEVKPVTTPLLRKVATFGRWLTAVILVLSLITFMLGYFGREYDAAEMFLAVVALAVAAIPEGLPAIITATLAVGIRKMARRNAIIRELPAVETLGAVTVICSDKTGTLTCNEMTVETVATGSEVFSVSGVGYEPHGGIKLDENEVNPDDHAELLEIARIGFHCNESELKEKDGQWVLEGDPTEGALHTLALKAGLDPRREREEFARLDVLPFESSRQYMATLHKTPGGEPAIFLKGAPERVLKMCSQQAGETQGDFDPESWQKKVEQLASKGQRVLAVAKKPADRDNPHLSHEKLDSGFSFLGLVGMMDPPREEARRAISQCREAKIQVKMITGDHAITAGAIAGQLGIGNDGRAVTGRDVERMDETQLRDEVPQVDVFARTSPEQKLRLVKALQREGHIVSMTGDGVNDAPALKRADVGVAMGVEGSEAAKEAAEMVLADDNFASIVAAVEEGRTVDDNLTKALQFILPTNGGEAMVILTAILFGFSLPMTPVQLLWVNTVTAVTLAVAIAFEAAERGVMRRPPRDPQTPLLSGWLIWRVVFVSILLVIGTMGIFAWETARDASPQTARTAAVTLLVFAEAFYLFNSRHLLSSSINLRSLIGNHYAIMAVAVMIILQLTFIYAPFAQWLFDTAPIPRDTWGVILAFGAALFCIVEIEKAVIRRMKQKR